MCFVHRLQRFYGFKLKMEIFDGLSDEEEEFLDFLEHPRRPYVVKDRFNPFDEYDDLDFFMRFRLKKETVLMVLEQIEEQIETITDRYVSRK